MSSLKKDILEIYKHEKKNKIDELVNKLKEYDENILLDTNSLDSNLLYEDGIINLDIIKIYLDYSKTNLLVAEKNKFFSYRRSKKLCENDYGRCISVISLI